MTVFVTWVWKNMASGHIASEEVVLPSGLASTNLLTRSLYRVDGTPKKVPGFTSMKAFRSLLQ